MPRPRKRKARKRKGKVRVSTQAQVRKKNEEKKDTLPQAPSKVYPENAAHFKVKIRKK